MKLTRQQIKLIEHTDRILKNISDIDYKLYETFDNKFYEAHLTPVFYTSKHVEDLLFILITGEDHGMDEFYKRFDSPGLPQGKPIAWIEGSGFIPDRINDILMSRTVETKQKITDILKLYNMCKKLEKSHRVGKK